MEDFVPLFKRGASRVYHTSDPVPVRRPAFLDWTSLPEADKLQTSPRGDVLALLLTLGSANTWYGDFHPDSYVPCLAHTLQ